MQPDTVSVLDANTITEPSDSLVNDLPSDSTYVEAEDEGTSSAPLLDATVTYTATDSVTYDLYEKKAYLHGNGKVTYKNINLTADYIALDFNNKEVFATGVLDSTNTIVGKPIFKQGSEEFETDTIRYNFETQKGIITGVVTEQQGGFVHSGRTKMVNDSTFNLVNGKYTTCDAEHPHFHLQMTKAKVISGKTIVTGPAYLVFEDIPIYPAFIPFGFFPNNSKYSSGFLMPSYGEENERGFFLRDMGYYWAASDYFDVAVRGDIYSKGSRGVKFHSNYKWRYKFSGSLDIKYYKNVYGEPGFTTGDDAYRESKDFAITWSHRQDSKANPYQTFNASVNFSTSSFDLNNSNSAQNYLTNTKSSSVSYTKKWPNSPFSFSGSFRHSQNSRDTTISLTLPQANLSMARIYPFKRKISAGEDRWYEKIGINYNMDIQNKINTHEDELLGSSFSKDWQNGVRHTMSASTSMKFLKYVSISPSVSYNERWYSKEIRQELDSTTNRLVVADTLYGFSRSYDYSTSVSASTKIYGMYQMINPNWKVKAIRHVMTPTIGFSYRPDFSEERFGMYGSVRDTTGNELRYAFNNGGIYGTASSGKSGSISFGLNNTVELKKLNSRDTTSNEKFKKVSIFDQLSFNTSYNLAADSLNLSTIRVTGRTKIAGINLNYGANFDPYKFDETINRRVDKFGLDLTSANLSFGLDFSSSKGKDKKGGGQSDDDNPNELGETTQEMMESEGKLLPGEYPEYADFEVPWNLNMDYSLRYSRSNPSVDASITQTVNFSGDLNLTEKWKVGFSSGYDIQEREITYTQFNIYRDLHCWQMSFNMVPFGYRQSYSFTIRASSSMLKDLKLSKRQSWYDNN